MEAEDQQHHPRRPSRRALLVAGATAGVGVVAGAGILLDRAHHDPEEPTASPGTTSPAVDWEDRDPRFTNPLRDSGEGLSIARTYQGVFPSLKVRDVLPLPGLGDAAWPWMATSIIGTSNQLQITRSGETSPHIVLDVPAQTPAEILSMAWDPTRRTLYLSAGGKIWAWRYASPSTIDLFADVPGATALYELLVDPHGVLWGGTFPLGAVFTAQPGNRTVKVYSRVAADTDYVRRVAMDAAGQVWIGTGARNPRLFTFPRTAPESRMEIALPDPLQSGFIIAIRAGTTKVRVITDGLPDVFELDTRSRTWVRRFRAKGWVRTPSSTILQDDGYFMIQGEKLYAYTGSTPIPVAESPSDALSTIHIGTTPRLLTAPTAQGFRLTTLTAPSDGAGPTRTAVLRPGEFKVQSLLAPADGTLYVGGFMGSGIAGIDPDTDKRWHSPESLDVVDQIENMISDDDGRIFLGTYSWADVIACDIEHRDSASSYTRIARFSTTYHQSRPYGLAANSTSVFVGTVPNYGRSGGILAKIDIASDKVEWVLDGAGKGIIPGHSVVGLAADDEFVYGTTSVRNGSGAADTPGLGHVFKVGIASRKTVWQSAPVPGAGALYTPHLLAGWLLVADIEGIHIVDPRTGELAAQHKISGAVNSSQRPGWASAQMTIIGNGSHIAHGSAGGLSVARFATGTYARVAKADKEDQLGPRLAATPSGSLFATLNSTDIAKVTLQN